MRSCSDEGKIKHLALTNFDTEHLQTIVDAGIRIVSNQVQYSLVDRRPEVRMAPFCQRARHRAADLRHAVRRAALASATSASPSRGRAELETASAQKYKQMIDAWGGWALFQELLAALKGIADKHGVSIANVAVRAILDRPAVAGVIVGARLGLAEHLADNARVFDLRAG